MKSLYHRLIDVYPASRISFDFPKQIKTRRLCERLRDSLIYQPSEKMDKSVQFPVDQTSFSLMRMITRKNYCWLFSRPCYVTMATASLSYMSSRISRKIRFKKLTSATFHTSNNHKQDLYSIFFSFLATMSSSLFRPAIANRWFTKSSPGRLFTASLFTYAKENNIEGNRKSKETLQRASRLFDPLLIRENGWVSPVSRWSNRFFTDAHELLTISPPTWRGNGDCWVWFSFKLIKTSTTIRKHRLNKLSHLKHYRLSKPRWQI